MTSLSEKDWQRFNRLAQKYLEHPQYRRMAGFVQHGTVSTYDHCVRVARTSFAWACAIKRMVPHSRLSARINEKDLAAGALLHDLYLYDWHDRTTAKPSHATKHPLYACENATRYFALSPQARNIIESHMWPLPPQRVPQSLEAVLVCVADKWCCLGETLRCRRKPTQRAQGTAQSRVQGAATSCEQARAQSRAADCAQSRAQGTARSTAHVIARTNKESAIPPVQTCVSRAAKAE